MIARFARSKGLRPFNPSFGELRRVAPGAGALFALAGALLVGCKVGHTPPVEDVVIPPVALPEILVIQEAHRDVAVAVDYSPDGKRFVTGGEGGAVKLWDASGALLHEWIPHVGRIRDVAFSPDGSVIAATDEDAHIHVFDARSLAVRADAEIPGARRGVGELSFSADGTRIAVVAGNRVSVIDAITWEEEVALKIGAPSVRSVAFHPDGVTLAVGAADGTLELWDVDAATRRSATRGAEEGLRRVAFDPAGTRLAVGYAGSAKGDGGFVEVRDAQAASVQVTLNAGAHRMEDLAWSANGALLAAAQQNGVTVFDVAAKSVKHRFEHKGVPARGVAFAPGAPRDLASVDGYGGVHVWDVVDGVSRVDVKGQRDRIADLAGRGGRIVAAACDGVRIWTGASVSVLKGHEPCVNGVDVTRDGLRAASVAADGRLVLWDTTSGARLSVVEEQGAEHQVVAFRPDGAQVAVSGSDGKVRLYDGVTGAPVATWAGHDYGVRALAWSHDGKRVATGGRDERVLVWDAAAGAPTDLGKQPGPIVSLVWSPDSKQLAVATKGASTIRVLDAASGALVTELDGHDAAVTAVAWRESGTILSGDEQGHVVRRADGQTTEVAPLPLVPVSDLQPLPGLVVGVASSGIHLWKPDGSWAQLRVMPGESGPVGLVVSSDGRFYGAAEALGFLRHVRADGAVRPATTEDPGYDPGLLAAFGGS